MHPKDEKLQPRLGTELRMARMRLELTQEQVAKAVGFVPTVYGRIERGDMVPSTPKLKALCALLGISADTLLGTNLQQAPPPQEPPAPPPGDSPEAPAPRHDSPRAAARQAPAVPRGAPVHRPSRGGVRLTPPLTPEGGKTSGTGHFYRFAAS
ncbi:helix-turn-helix domain-containing protein [Archangium gephyra]|uniref:helix-turn-helix domain-containing protein n=1 Tax=Archangium gephyra TaxID=48 RepID=UPI003B7CCABA